MHADARTPISASALGRANSDERAPTHVLTQTNMPSMSLESTCTCTHTHTSMAMHAASKSHCKAAFKHMARA
eukprot:15465272-Alexandrium_andersonii.AAC.1